MTDYTVVVFTPSELRALLDGARALLAEPAGVFPGPAAVAHARVLAAMKILRAEAEANHKKFLELPTLAPYAARLIVEMIAGEPSTEAWIAAERAASAGRTMARTARARAGRSTEVDD